MQPYLYMGRQAREKLIQSWEIREHNLLTANKRTHQDKVSKLSTIRLTLKLVIKTQISTIKEVCMMPMKIQEFWFLRCKICLKKYN